MRLLFIPILFAAFGYLVYLFAGQSVAIPQTVADLQVWLQGFSSRAWAVGSLLIIGDAILPLPSDITIFSLGVIYGGLLGGFIGGTAATCAALVGYGITRSLGEKGALLLVGEKDLGRARHFYAKWGFLAIALGRAIGGPAEYLVVLAGLTKMPFKRVFFAILTGAYPAAFSMSFLGAFSLEQPLLAAALAVALVLALIAAFHLLTKDKNQVADQ